MSIPFLNTENVSIILFFIGIAGIILRRNMMLSMVSLAIMDSAIILFFLKLNTNVADNVPLAVKHLDYVVDAVPHALMLTSIVIGVAVQAVGMIMILDYYNNYKNINWDEASRLRETEFYE